MMANIEDKIPFWVVTANAPHGAIFQLSLPVGPVSLLRNIALNSSPSA